MELKKDANLGELLNSILEFIEELIAGIEAAFSSLKFVRNFEGENKDEYLPQ